MKTLAFFLLLSFAASDSFSLVNKSKQAYTNVYHYRNNISLKNFDGTISTIQVIGSSAILYNSDGSQSAIDLCGRSSTLTAIDGTSLSVFHNPSSSRVFNPDGTSIIINHMNNTSSCLTASGKHTIMHTFGDMRERRYKNRIDVLIHMNWLIQNEAVEATDELNREEHQN